MYTMPREFWDNDILVEIGNVLGNFFKIFEATRQEKYISYSIYINILGSLKASIDIYYEGEFWMYMLDYEHISFRCWWCHQYGHLYEIYTLVVANNNLEASLPKDSGGFMMVERN